MSLKGKRVAVLAEDNYEDLELWYPYYRMLEEGAEVTILGMPGVSEYKSKHGYPAVPDISADKVSAADFDAVIIPGGFAPDRMRRHIPMLDFVRGISDKGGIVAAICHAAWVPISAGIVKGKKATCVSAIKDDLTNAGASYLDEEVVVDGGFITSRTPRDLPAYCRAIIAALSQ